MAEVVVVEDDPRAELGKYYSMSGELPASVSTKAFLKRQNSNRSVNDDAYDHERNIISQMLQDSRITLAQRENISTSILNGKYQINSMTSSSENAAKTNIHLTEREISNTRNNFINLNRHNLRRPNFLEVVTESTKIPYVSPKEMYQTKISTIRAKGNEYKNPPFLSPKQKTEFDNAHSAKELQNQLLAEEKLSKVRLSREQALLGREEAMRVKRLEAEGTEKRVEIKRRLADFRQKLKEHLVQRHDPQLGSIMRCVDESMVYHFMEKYEGYSMSVEAILALIGNSLGSSTVRPDPLVLSTERDIVGNTRVRHGKKGSPRNGESLYIQDVAESYQRGRNPNSKSMNAIIFDTSFGKSKADSRTRAKRMVLGDEVMGIAPRKYTTEVITPLVAEKTMGSGFRTTRSRGSSRNGGVPSHTGLLTPLNAPMFRHDNVVKSPTKQYPSLSVLGSEHLRNSMELMEATNHFDPGPLRGEVSGSVVGGGSKTHNMQHGMSSSVAFDDGRMTQGAQDAISVMHEQLLEERLLPSMQPERALTETQLHELGTKAKTFEEIMSEVQGGGGSASSSTSKGGMSRPFIVNKPLSAIANARKNSQNKSGEASGGHNRNILLTEGDNETELELGGSALERPTSLHMVDPHNEDKPHSASSSSPTNKRLPLFGSVLSSEDKERFDQLTPAEIDYYRNSFGLSAKSPHEVDKERSKSFHEISMLMTDSVQSDRVQLAQPPRGIKTRTKYETKEGLTYLPISPFKTAQESMHVMNSGVPAGTGLMLWRPRQKVTPTGRYRAGQGSPLKARDHKKHEQVPFVSMT